MVNFLSKKLRNSRIIKKIITFSHVSFQVQTEVKVHEKVYKSGTLTLEDQHNFAFRAIMAEKEAAGYKTAVQDLARDLADAQIFAVSRDSEAKKAREETVDAVEKMLDAQQESKKMHTSMTVAEGKLATAEEKLLVWRVSS